MDRANFSHEIILIGAVEQTNPIIESLYNMPHLAYGFKADIFENVAYCYIDIDMNDVAMSSFLVETSVDFYDSSGFEDEPEFTTVSFYTETQLYSFTWSYQWSDWSKMLRDETSIMNLLSCNLFGNKIKSLREQVSCSLYTIELENEQD